MDELAHELSKRPSVHRCIDDGVERDAEYYEKQIGNRQVQNKEVRRVLRLYSVFNNNNDDEDVSKATEHDNDAECHADDYGLVTLTTAHVSVVGTA